MFLLLVAGQTRSVSRQAATSTAVESAEAKPTPLAFAQVVVHPPTAEPLRLRFAGGHELILPASMPIEQVAKLVHAIESTT
jgi:hypothetical protein